MAEPTPLGMFTYPERDIEQIRLDLREFWEQVELAIDGITPGGAAGLIDPGASGIVVRTSVSATVARQITGTANQISIANGDGVAANPSISIADNTILPGTGGFAPPSGTTAQRPGSPGNIIRFNTTSGRFEMFEGGQWKDLIGGTVAIAQLEHIATNRVLGRATAGTGPVEILTVLPTAIQDAITRLGTIVAGVWQGSTVQGNYGGTGHSTRAVGDLLIGGTGLSDDGLIAGMDGVGIAGMDGVEIMSMAGPTTADAWTRLPKNPNVSRYLGNTGIDNSPAWTQVDLTTGVTGVLLTASGGTGQTTYSNGQLLIGNAGGTLTKATLTQTANQVLVTNGSGSITLALPQDIATTSSVQFGLLKLNTAVQGLNSARLTVQTGAGASDDAIYIGPSTHATSRRALLRFDNWSIGQDRFSAGVKDFFVYDNALGAGDRIYISTIGNVGIGTTAGLAKLSINGGVHIGGDTDPGDNNLLVDGNINVSGFIGHPDYVSQTTKWRIDNLGAGDFRYLFTDELHAKAFIADLEQALAGGQIITKSVGVLGANFTAPAAGGTATLTMKDLPSASNMQIFETSTDGGLGDWIRIRTFSRASGSLSITDCWGRVTAYVDQAGGLQTYTFTRGSGVNAGAMTAGTIVETDAIILDYGVSGNGFYEVNAIDGLYGINSPHASIVTWSGASPIAANQTLRSRFGNLRGVTAITNEFGFIAGTYAATNGQFIRASNQAFELHGINLLMWDAGVNVIKLDRTAPSFAIGSPVPSAYATGTGIWMGKDAGSYKMRVGIPGGAGWFWNGAVLTWQAANTTLDASGNLTASNATLSGQITATTGSIGGWSITAAAISSGGITLASHATPASNKIFVGTGTYGNANTPFYVDGSARFSLGAKLTWDNSTLGIDGSGIFSGSVKASSLFIGNFDNLAEDPGIERSTVTVTAWTLEANMFIAVSGGHSGTNCINNITNGSTARALNPFFVDCKPGDVFYCEGWCASTGGSYGTVIIAWYNAAKTFLSESVGSSNVGGFNVYVFQSVTATAPANAAFARAGFKPSGGTAGWTFDDIYMRRGELAGWIINATTITGTGVVMASGANAYLSFGTTPPTSATVGTGLFLDRTGLYGLNANVLQAKFGATDGKIVAGAGNLLLDAAGISIALSSTYSDTRAYSQTNGVGGAVASSLGGYVDANDNLALFQAFQVTGLNSQTLISCDAPTGKSVLIQLSTRIASATKMMLRLGDLGFDVGTPGNPALAVNAGGNVGIGDITNWGTGSPKSVLGLINGTEPTSSVADQIAIYSVDLSAGNATLGLRTETAVVTESVVSDRTLSIRINGTTYKLCLKV